MSVVGYDIGNSSCYVAVAKAGGIETADNDVSDRATPTCISFDDKVRLIGAAAKNQMASNVKNTVTGIKHLIGRKFNDPILSKRVGEGFYKVKETENGDVQLQLNYRGEELLVKPEQVMASLLQDLKKTSSNSTKTPTFDCVISVPSYFTDCQRNSMLEAAHIAGLNCLKLMNEPTAVSLCYGLFKQDLPAAEEPSRKVVFVDMGESSMQVCITAFNKGKIKVLSVASDPTLGGGDFDRRIGDYFAKQFLTKPKIDVKSRPKAWLRLLKDCESMKKKMSTVKTEVSFSIECLMDDADVKGKIDRAIFEEISEDLFSRVEAPLQQALTDSGLKLEDIHSVELVGGSTRIPRVRSIVQNVFQKELSATINADEAVSRGCAIQCAMLSHTVRVREIEVVDVCPYPYHISWTGSPNGSTGECEPGDMPMFKRFHDYPATKMLTLQRTDSFMLSCYYPNDVTIPHTEKKIGDFHVTGIVPSSQGEANKIKVKVRVNKHGCFSVSSATMVEKLPTPPPSPEKQEEIQTNGENTENTMNGDDTKEPEKMDVENQEKASTENTEEQPKENTDVEMPGESKTTDSTTNADPAAKTDPPAKGKKKKNIKQTDLTVIAQRTFGHVEDVLKAFVQREKDFVSEYEFESKRASMKNSIEEFIYKYREKICEETELQPFTTEEETDAINLQLDDADSWLYDEGDETTIENYENKLNSLKSLISPLEDRQRAHIELPKEFEKLGASLTRFRKIIDAYKAGDELYNHLTKEDMDKVEGKVDEKFSWLNKHMIAFQNIKKYEMPSVTCTLVSSAKKDLDSICNPIVNKKKPKVEPPKETPPEDAKMEGTEGGENSNETSKTTEEIPPAAPEGDAKTNLDMEVD